MLRLIVWRWFSYQQFNGTILLFCDDQHPYRTLWRKCGYPMEIEPDALVRQLKAQPMKTGFVRQVHAAQNLYGPQLRCDFAEKEIMAALSEPLEFYAKRDVPYIRDRVTACIKFQRKKLF